MAFEQLYYEILNEHAPLKQTVVRGKPGTIYDGTMVQGNKVPKQIMVAIYERSDERKLWSLQNSTHYTVFIRLTALGAY